MAKYWDCSDTSKHWEISRQLKEMIEGNRYRSYNGVYPDSVEDVYINTDGSADVDLYGRDVNDKKGHYHFHLKLYSDGTFTLVNCHKK